jgi:hypothetical protein
MKWIDILNERHNIQDLFKSFALDLLLPLYKKDVEKVSFEKFKKQIMANPDIVQGIDLDNNFFMDNLTQLEIVDKVEPDPNTQNMMIWFSGNDTSHKSGKDDAEKKQDKLDANATKQAVKKVKSGDNPL